VKKPSQQAKPLRHTALGGAVLLLVGVYLGVWLYLDPPLRYHASAPIFFLGSDFLAQLAGRPGGLLHYGSAFLAQLDCQAWLGAAVFTMIVGLLSLGTRLLLSRSGTRLGLAFGLPGFLLLVLHGQYSPPVLEIGGGVLLTVAGWLAWLAGPKRPLVGRLAFGWGLAAVLFQVAGLLPCLLFLVVAGMHEILCGRQWVSGLGCWLPILAWPLGLAARTSISPWDVVSQGGGGLSLTAITLLHVFYPIAIATGVLLPKTPPPGPKESRAAQHRQSATARKSSSPSGARAPWAIRVGVCGLVVAAFALTVDTRRKALIRIQYAAEQQDWNDVLASATRLQACPAPARLQIDRALFHTGTLTSDLFSFPRRNGTDLLPSLEAGLEVCLPLSDTLVELGQVNLAEHYAHEALEVRGERPELLWRLARINLVKERPEAARVFLNVLRQVPFHRARAGYWLRALDLDPSLAGEEEITRLRSLRVRTDLTERRFSTETLLRDLLRSNRQNRMAVEYLMSHFLLTRQADQVAQNIGLLDSTGRPGIPRHLEEAILLYAERKDAKPLDLQGRRVSEETVRRFQRFVDVLRRNRARAPDLEPALARDFGDTYWFYELFGRTFGPAGLPVAKTNR
jgi:hypothetical protein